MKPLPLADLEQLIALPKYLADPARDMADLHRRPKAERDDYARRLQSVQAAYSRALDSFAADPYLEGYLALAQLKLAAVAQRLGEDAPDSCAFPLAAFRTIEQLEEMCLLERLTPQELVDNVGESEGARLAARLGLHLTADIALDPEIPGPLAFAFRRVYRRRLARAREAAKLYVERYGLQRLAHDIQEACPSCQRLTLDADHARALSQASLEVLIALAPPEQARVLGEIGRLKIMQGMDAKQILAAMAERQPRALEALREMATGAAATGQLELYERLVQELKAGLASQREDSRLALQGLVQVMDKSLDTVKSVAWAASARGGSACPACQRL